MFLHPRQYNRLIVYTVFYSLVMSDALIYYMPSCTVLRPLRLSYTFLSSPIFSYTRYTILFPRTIFDNSRVLSYTPIRSYVRGSSPVLCRTLLCPLLLSYTV